MTFPMKDGLGGSGPAFVKLNSQEAEFTRPQSRSDAVFKCSVATFHCFRPT